MVMIDRTCYENVLVGIVQFSCCFSLSLSCLHVFPKSEIQDRGIDVADVVKSNRIDVRQTPSLVPHNAQNLAPSSPHRIKSILDIIRDQIELAQILSKDRCFLRLLRAILVRIVVTLAVCRFINRRIRVLGHGECVQGLRRIAV